MIKVVKNYEKQNVSYEFVVKLTKNNTIQLSKTRLSDNVVSAVFTLVKSTRSEKHKCYFCNKKTADVYHDKYYFNNSHYCSECVNILMNESSDRR